MKKQGFTLIELLVVIAIIAILAAILFPIFVTARERGRQAKCCSNLKQLTLAFFSYADDNNGYMPISARRHFSGQLSQAADIEWTGTQWYSWSDTKWPPIDVRQGSLYKGGYVRNVAIFQCPTDVNLPSYYVSGSSFTKIMGPPSSTPGFGLSYSVNWQLTVKTIPDSNPVKYDTIKLAQAVAGRSGTVLFLIHESRGDPKHTGINDGYFSWPGDFFDKIHYNGTTCSYADGHVKWIGSEEMQRCENTVPSPWWRNSYYYRMTKPETSE